MQERQPSVFVSSTFFDLKQVRNDIALYIERELGYRLLVSEHSSFPVDPTFDTIENCRRRVRHDADIFVLIIGGRYGSVPAGHNKSVTNLEYDTARTLGIPIFAFIEREVLSVLPVWRDNPSADFSGVCDARVFEFIEQVRAVDRVWAVPFDTA